MCKRIAFIVLAKYVLIPSSILQECYRLCLACVLLLQGPFSEEQRRCAAVVHLLVTPFPKQSYCKTGAVFVPFE